MSISTASANPQSQAVLRQEVLGSRRLSNYWWASVISIGGVGFFLSSLSSYLGVNLLPFSNPTQLIFIPQGIAMGFYGVAALLLAAYLWLVITWNVGGGYNEFDKDAGEARVFRWGFPGKNRRIEVVHPLSEVQSIYVDLKEGLNPKRALYLRVKGKRDIPLTRVGQPLGLSALENQGAELARFLTVPLEGL
ncbi:MAG: photosystem I assembly protein Ycf4 [Cyanobacteria bacterium P01_A01_bin.135]